MVGTKMGFRANKGCVFEVNIFLRSLTKLLHCGRKRFGQRTLKWSGYLGLHYQTQDDFCWEVGHQGRFVKMCAEITELFPFLLLY